MASSFGEIIDPCSIIKTILKQYRLGNGLIRELIQNSDDAGAKEQVIVLDRRTHGKTSLVDPVLSATQGPSLLSYNNSTFSEEDWVALQSISVSNKTLDENKAGKYGLGFRSVYHITDNPHILSASTLVIFDPHRGIGAGGGGVKCEHVFDEPCRNDWADQLSAFSSLLDKVTPSAGTIVRLPLRTEDQAKVSRIRNESFTADTIKDLMVTFIEKEVSVTLLFLRHITSIRLVEVDEEGRRTELLHVSRQDSEHLVDQRSFGNDTNQAQFESFRCSLSFSGSMTTTRTILWRICHETSDSKEASKIIAQRLHNDDVDFILRLLRDEKLFPHVAVAYPLETCKQKGQLFDLLPLPIFTYFPFHINAEFSLQTDRQSLCNKDDVGLEKSRERVQVEWNTTIFNTFLPQLYAQTLEILVQEDRIHNIWDAWPQVSSDRYWSELPFAIVKEAVTQNKAIFPQVLDPAGQPAYISLKDALVAPPNCEMSILLALSRAGCVITRPPAEIYHCVAKLQLYKFEIPHLRSLLECRLQAVQLLSDADKAVLITFLLPQGSSTLENIAGLPLFPTIGKMFTSLSSSSLLADKEEQFLFADQDPSMISLDSLAYMNVPSHVLTLVSRPALATSHFPKHIELADVTKFVKKKFSQFSFSALPEMDCDADYCATYIPWLRRFWAWIDDKIKAGIFSIHGVQTALFSLQLLPTVTNRLRSAQAGFMSRNDLDEDIKDVLSNAGIPFLHKEMDEELHIFAGGRVRHAAFDVAFVSDHLSPLSNSSIPVIQRYFCLYANHSSRTLSHRHRQDILRLPIFPILMAKNHVTPGSVSDSRPAIFVMDTSCPLPIQNVSCTFIDVSQSQPFRALALYADENYEQLALNEIQLLERHAIPVLEDQPPHLMDELLKRIVSRAPDLGHIIHCLELQRFILVQNGERKRPCDVIHPKSAVAPLYVGEDAMFPRSPYDNEEYLRILGPYFIRTLDADAVQNRIQHVSASGDIWKAQELLRFLDMHWSESFRAVIRVSSHDQCWVPDQDNRLQLSSDCCCAPVPELLFDLVHPTCFLNLKSSDLRNALGWGDDLPFATVMKQLRLTFTQSSNQNHRRRVMAILKYLAQLTLSDDQLNQIQEAVNGQKWVPVASLSSASSLAHPCHAYLDMEVDIRGPFHQVQVDLLDIKERNLLQKLGCCARPSFNALAEELRVLQEKQNLSSVRQRHILHILEEISLHHPILSLPKTELQRILVPVDIPGEASISLKPSTNVYYDDRLYSHELNTLDRPHRVTYKQISEDLAKRLFIPLASSLDLDFDEDEGLDLKEDVIHRISGILRQYNIVHSYNEFAANAIDAGATEFSICLDTRSQFANKKLLSPGMKLFNELPSLVLYNNAKFSSEDFDGIRKIGQGGKASRPGTIGKFGLGALTAFHFTDVMTILSGEYIMFIDPLGMYLPLYPDGRKRTTLKMRISSATAKFPDQLAPFESSYGFSSASGVFDGTLFRLPLRSENNPSPLSSRGFSIVDRELTTLVTEDFYHIARSALLFTSLRLTTAYKRTRQTSMQLCWTVEGHKTEQSIYSLTTQLSFSPSRLVISHRKGDDAPTREEWRITSAAFPLEPVSSKHLRALEEQKLLRAERGIQVSIASPVPCTTPGQTFALFCHLALPVATSLPAHVNAPFCLAADRRSVRYDAPDSSGRRPIEAEFNHFILSELAPQVWMAHLALLAREIKEEVWELWPSSQEHIYSISRVVSEGFYGQLPSCKHPICPTASGEVISPQCAHFSLPGMRSPRLPAKVQYVVKRLHSSTFVDPPDRVRKRCKAVQGLAVADAKFLRDLISGQAMKYHALWADDKNACVDEVLLYLLENNESPSGLFLLQLENKGLHIFPSPGHPTVHIHTYPSKLANLFADGTFLSDVYSEATIKLLLADSALCIQRLDSTSLAQMIDARIPAASRSKLSTADGQWIASLWDALHSESLADINPMKLSPFRQIPLIPTHTDGEFVSLEFASSRGVSPPVLDMPEWMPGVLHSLGIVVVHTRTGILQSQIHLQPPTMSLTTLMERLSTLEKLGLADLSSKERQLFAQWIRERVPRGSLSYETVKSLRQVPMWPSSSENDSDCVLISADKVLILPAGVSLHTIKPFILSRYTVTERSEALCCLEILETDRRRHVGSKSFPGLPLQLISRHNIMEHLDIPNTLDEDSIISYHHLVQAFIAMEVVGFMIPDGNGILRKIEKMYDDTIQIFTTSFSRAALRRSNFIHPEYNNFRSALITRGLQARITENTLLACARALDEDLNTQSPHSLREQAQLVFQSYCHDLPSIYMADAAKWARFEHLKLIPTVSRDQDLGRNSSFGKEHFCVPVLPIATVKEIILPVYYDVCWSQRAICDLQDVNIEALIRLNDRFGVPSVKNVVDHLHTLATQVALSHSGNTELLRSIIATYDWLQEHLEEASSYLQKHLLEPLFLNVDDPSAKKWKWQCANNLVFDLRWNSSLFGVRSFLLSRYTPLLKAAGVKTWTKVDMQTFPHAATNINADIRSRFNELRKSGILMDCILKPTAGDDLPAHASFLVAMVPRLQITLQSGMLEQRTREIPFSGCADSARCVLDFIYTGEFQVELPSGPDCDDEDAWGSLLSQLFAILDAANHWSMPELKAYICNKIQELDLLTPDTFGAIKQAAEDYHAKELLAYCAECERDPERKKLLREAQRTTVS